MRALFIQEFELTYDLFGRNPQSAADREKLAERQVHGAAFNGTVIRVVDIGGFG